MTADLLLPFGWLHALREPAVALTWSPADWERVIRLARRLRLLARLGAALDGGGLFDEVPVSARRHLLSEARLSQWRTGAMLWLIDRVGATLGRAGHPLVLLKGAAYIGQQLPIAAGRMPADVDILVPLAQLAATQAALVADGWEEIALDAHDSRYYREWSHETPPMRHPLHRIELDLHHNILPPIARTRVDAAALLARLQPSIWPAWQVLHPLDQVLHSAAHLFQDSEVRDRLRDLVDIDALLRHFGATPGFWQELPERARELGLAEPLALAVHFCRRWLGTAVPEAAQSRIAALGPGALRRAWLLPMLTAILTPAGVDRAAPWQQHTAAALFLARYHRNRLPLRLLVPHVWHKLRPPRDAAEAANAAAP